MQLLVLAGLIVLALCKVKKLGKRAFFDSKMSKDQQEGHKDKEHTQIPKIKEIQLKKVENGPCHFDLLFLKEARKKCINQCQ